MLLREYLFAEDAVLRTTLGAFGDSFYSGWPSAAERYRSGVRQRSCSYVSELICKQLRVRPIEKRERSSMSEKTPLLLALLDFD